MTTSTPRRRPSQYSPRQAPSGSTHRPAAPRPQRKRFSERLDGLVNYLDRQPSLDYQAIRSIVLILVGIGVVMVFSSSMTWSIQESSSVWAIAIRQGLMVALGLVVFWAMLKIPIGWIRKSAKALFWISIALLILVLIPGLGTGRAEVGSQSWLNLRVVQLQPSELAKVAIAVRGAAFLAGHTHERTSLRSPFTQFIICSLVMFALIVAEGDLGMAVSFAIEVAFLLIFAGIKWQVITVGGIIAVLGMAGVFLTGGFRSDRFHTYFSAFRGDFADTKSAAFQSYQGFLSLADGSLGGVGLGQSRAKWFYLPESKNDFIFAIIGEELGLWGGAFVILLFAGLGFFGFRAAMRAQNQFQSLMAATLTAGVVSQAFINIGYVIGLLPVTGIQLPMISAGGTSAVITIGSMGILASVARHEPETVSAMQNYGRPFSDRLFGLPEPAPEAEEMRERKARKKVARQPKARVRQPLAGRAASHDERRIVGEPEGRRYAAEEREVASRPVRQATPMHPRAEMGARRPRTAGQQRPQGRSAVRPQAGQQSARGIRYDGRR